MKKILIIFGTVILLVILLLLWDSDEQILGDNYFYLPNYEALDVGFPGGGIIYKSPQKYLIREIKISGNVAEAKANKDFIIAKQDADTSYADTISKIEIIKSLKYFIIVKKLDIVYGPFTKQEYLKKRDELGISENIQFK